MLKFISQKSVEYLIKRGKAKEERKAVYIYGCELLFSTSFSALSIITLGLIFGKATEAVTFILFFMPIRTVAGGYHAKTYGACFLITGLIAVGCVTAAYLSVMNGIPFWILASGFILAQLCIFVNAPLNSKRHPLKPARILKNRNYMLRIQAIEIITAAVLLYAGMMNEAYTAMITTIVVAVMIEIAKKEERRYA